MFKRYVVRKYAIVLLSLFVLSCQKDEKEVGLLGPNLLSVSFQKANNPSLESDIKLDFNNEDTFSGFVPYGTSIRSLIATYEFAGSSLQIDGEEQTNSVSSNDFGKERMVSILDEGGNGKDYLIRLHYHTGLPIVYLSAFDPETAAREYYISAEISIYGGLDFQDIENRPIQIRGRGNSTWTAEEDIAKKPYQIKFSEGQEVLGMADDRRWVLLAEYFDRSMIRNKLSYEMGQMSNFDYSPQGEYVEVFINDQPQGTYVLAQKVEESKNRLDIGDNGYLIEMDQRYRVAEDDVYFEPPIFRQRAEKFSWLDTIYNIKEPADIQYGSEAYSNIENFVNAFEEVLFGDNFKDSEEGYRSYIDLDSFIDWYLINEIGKSVDAYGYASVFFSYVPGEKIKMGPIWDFDLSYGNADYSAPAFYVEGNHINQHPWFERLLEDNFFRQKVIERYTHYYDKRDEFLALIDKFSDQINRSQVLNYELYQNLGEEMWNNGSAVFQTHAEEVEYLKNWLFEHINWMNGNL